MIPPLAWGIQNDAMHHVAALLRSAIAEVKLCVSRAGGNRSGNRHAESSHSGGVCGVSTPGQIELSPGQGSWFAVGILGMPAEMHACGGQCAWATRQGALNNGGVR